MVRRPEPDGLAVGLRLPADVERVQVERGANRGQIVGEAVNFTRDMANEPGAYLTPTDMANRAREMPFGLRLEF